MDPHVIALYYIRLYGVRADAHAYLITSLFQVFKFSCLDAGTSGYPRAHERVSHDTPVHHHWYPHLQTLGRHHMRAMCACAQCSTQCFPYTTCSIGRRTELSRSAPLELRVRQEYAQRGPGELPCPHAKRDLPESTAVGSRALDAWTAMGCLYHRHSELSIRSASSWAEQAIGT